MISNTQNLYSIVKGERIEAGGYELKLSSERTTSEKVLDDLINDDAEAGQEKADQQLEEYQNSKLTNSVTGRRNGIFAGIANDISSGNLYMIFFDGIHSVIHSSKVSFPLL